MSKIAGGKSSFQRARAIALYSTIFLFSLIITAISSFAGNWTWQNPLPRGNDLRAVWGSGPDDVFAVGSHGTILHYDGSSWTAMDSGTTEDLHGVWGTSGSDVYAVGSEPAYYEYNETLDAYPHTVLHYDGNTWSQLDLTGIVNPSATIQFRCVWGLSENDVYLVGYAEYIGDYEMARYGYALHYDGTAWHELTLYEEDVYNGIWGMSESDLYVAARDGGNLYELNGSIVHFDGNEWDESYTPSPMADFYGVWGLSENRVYAAGATQGGNGKGIVMYYDGSGWREAASTEARELRGIWGYSSNEIFAVGASGTILRYNGVSWSETAAGPQTDLYGAWGSSGTDVFAVGNAGTILHYDGTAWTEMSSGAAAAQTIRDIWGATGIDMFAVGDSGNHSPVQRDRLV